MLRRLTGVGGGLLLTASAALAQGGAASQVAGGSWTTLAHGVIHPWITILLLFAGCLLIFIDLLTPKTWEWTGTLGVVFVGVVFAAHVTEGTGAWVGIVLMLGGVGLLLLETHVFPGRGVAAISGLLALFLGMFIALGGSSHAVLALPVASILTVVALVAFFAYLPKSPLWNTISQQMRGRSTTDYTAQNPLILVGQAGTTLTVLRPFGVAQFAGSRFDVVTEGDFLDANAPVLVTQVRDGRVVVEPVLETLSAVQVARVAEA